MSAWVKKALIHQQKIRVEWRREEERMNLAN
jgi:hypothetical protein